MSECLNHITDGVSPRDAMRYSMSDQSRSLVGETRRRREFRLSSQSRVPETRIFYADMSQDSVNRRDHSYHTYDVLALLATNEAA